MDADRLFVPVACTSWPGVQSNSASLLRLLIVIDVLLSSCTEVVCILSWVLNRSSILTMTKLGSAVNVNVRLPIGTVQLSRTVLWIVQELLCRLIAVHTETHVGTTGSTGNIMTAPASNCRLSRKPGSIYGSVFGNSHLQLTFAFAWDWKFFAHLHPTCVRLPQRWYNTQLVHKKSRFVAECAIAIEFFCTLWLASTQCITSCM